MGCSTSILRFALLLPYEHLLVFACVVQVCELGMPSQDGLLLNKLISQGAFGMVVDFSFIWGKMHMGGNFNGVASI